MANNRAKPIRVHAWRKGGDESGVETECGTIGRTMTGPGEWRTALGNPFKIGTGDAVTCVGCRRWLKVKHA